MVQLILRHPVLLYILYKYTNTNDRFSFLTLYSFFVQCTNYSMCVKLCYIYVSTMFLSDLARTRALAFLSAPKSIFFYILLFLFVFVFIVFFLLQKLFYGFAFNAFALTCLFCFTLRFLYKMTIKAETNLWKWSFWFKKKTCKWFLGVSLYFPCFCQTF